jgi:glycerol-3-phosphate acyltransferase PlsY
MLNSASGDCTRETRQVVERPNVTTAGRRRNKTRRVNLGLVEQPGASLILIIGAYLLGSLASAILISRALGLPDPRAGGSGNPGTTNVLRLGGKKAAALTMGGDISKGLVPVLIAHQFGATPSVVILVAIAAFLGHLYPLFFSFKGGKGVATALGVLAGISWMLGGAVLLTWLLVLALTRYSSLSALVAGLTTPAFAFAITEDPSIVGGTAVIAALLIWRHRSNITRLINGVEDKVGSLR